MEVLLEDVGDYEIKEHHLVPFKDEDLKDKIRHKNVAYIYSLDKDEVLKILKELGFGAGIAGMKKEDQVLSVHGRLLQLDMKKRRIGEAEMKVNLENQIERTVPDKNMTPEVYNLITKVQNAILRKVKSLIAQDTLESGLTSGQQHGQAEVREIEMLGPAEFKNIFWAERNEWSFFIKILIGTTQGVKTYHARIDRSSTNFVGLVNVVGPKNVQDKIKYIGYP